MGRRRVRMTNKPSYRFANYTEHWEEKKLGEVSTSFSGGTPAAANKKYYGGEIPFIRSAEINSDTTELFLTKEGLDNSSAKLVKEGDILYALYGATSGEVGISKINGAINQAVLSIIPKNNYTSEFIMQWLRLQKKNITDKYLQGGQGNLSGSIVKELGIFFPTLPEQTAIGSFFQDIDQLIRLQQRKLEVLKEQKKTYLKLLFPAKGQKKPALRFAGFEDEWKEVKLGEVFDIVTDYVANGSFESLRNNVKTYEKENFAYMIRLQDASNSWRGPWLYTDEKGYNFLSKSRLFKDDILMSNVGTVGRFFQVPELDRPMTLAPNSVLIRSTSSNNQFLYFMMLTSNIQDQITMRKTPGVQDKINKTDFKKVIATLPSLPEQQTIGSFFQDLDKVIAKQEEKVNQLKESKQTLLRKMFI